MINTSSVASRGNKQKRIEKELLALRNLPTEFKIGKKETGLGILLYVSLRFDIICDNSLRWKGHRYRGPKAWTNRFIASTLKYF